MIKIKNMANEQLATKFKALSGKIKHNHIMKCAAAGVSSDTTIRKYLRGEIPDSKNFQAMQVYLFLSRLIQKRKLINS